ncbi:hypothetical protein C0J52_15179 [Blattella germanica]|nr:hypothetical protein C0J52_15179 [Blattella germanica]
MERRRSSYDEGTVTGASYIDVLQQWFFPQLKQNEPENLIDNKMAHHSTVSPFSPTFAAQELRKCLLRHNWDGAARLLIMMLDESSAYMRKILINSCLLTVMYHPNSTQQLREEFIRKCSGVSDANELFKSLKRFPNKKLMKKRRRRTNMKESDI